MIKDNKISIVYIASGWRSGSTILDVLLGSFRGGWTIGEANVIPWEFREQIRVCGCSKPITQCPFWKSVRLKNYGVLCTDSAINKFRENYSAGILLRPAELIRFFLKRGFPKKEFSKFCRDNSTLFELVQTEAEKVRGTKINFIIDASKDFYRAFWLSVCKSLDVKIVHITKDPRAFVYSMTKTDKDSLHKLLKVLRMGFRYVFENYLVYKLSRRLPENQAIHIRYEDLALEPEKTLRLLAKWLGVPYNKGIVTSFRSIENHGIAGNISRLKSDRIQLDDKWRTNFNPMFKFLILLLTYFSSKKYGYFK